LEEDIFCRKGPKRENDKEEREERGKEKLDSEGKGKVKGKRMEEGEETASEKEKVGREKRNSLMFVQVDKSAIFSFLPFLIFIT
jgi:hypothetical protein